MDKIMTIFDRIKKTSKRRSYRSGVGGVQVIVSPGKVISLSELRRSCCVFAASSVLILCIVLSHSALAQQPPPYPTNPPAPIQRDPAQKPVTEKIGDGLYQIGNVLVDIVQRKIKVMGWVNMSEGLVEYLAVTPRGKLHESVLALDVQPIHLQIGLILLDLNFGGNIRYQGDPQTPKGDPVEIFVEWNENGVTKKVRGEELIYNKATDSALPKSHWVFTGSAVINGQFMADREGSLIATYHDPWTIIDNPQPSGSDDTILFANKKLLPAPNTPVTVFIRASTSGG